MVYRGDSEQGTDCVETRNDPVWGVRSESY